MKVRSLIIIAVWTTSITGCDIRPAEEFIEDTGAANFVASFEVASGISAPWESDDKLIVIDSENISHKFGLDAGAKTDNGEFSGTISPKSRVKYIVYSNDVNDVFYDGENGDFFAEIPSAYTATAANVLVKANNVAIGTLQGSEVALKSVCGFLKFTLEANGLTQDIDGVTYELTDLKEVTIKSEDGKSFAGKIHAKWTDSEASPTYLGVEEGVPEITFRTRTLTTEDGNVYYQAGDYYIPVIPQNYEDVTVTVKDDNGNVAVAVKNRALDVRASMLSNLNEISWPTLVVSVNFNTNSLGESQSHPAHNFPSVNLSVERVSKTSQQKVAGASKKQEIVDMKDGNMTYQIWATNGYAKFTKQIGASYCLTDIVFNHYNANWSYGGDTWTVGSPNGYAWVRIPEFDGVLYKMEVQIMSDSEGPFSISTEVDSETGASLSDIQRFMTKKSFNTYTAAIPKQEPGTAYYICMGNGYDYRLQSWKLFYKVYE